MLAMRNSTAALFAALAVLKLLLIPGYHSTDFEVHRNWLAITHSLPLSRWYYEDLSEWTLDYPPFFAAMEWVLSWPAMLFDPEMLVVSNLGHASASTVLFQRLSVITLDCALAGAAARLCSRLYPDSPTRQALAVALTICNPGLLLVDHVHFQYNGVLYALLLCCLAEFLSPQPNPLLGGSLFAALLNFKHIFLYFVPAVFVFLLRGYCCGASPAGVQTGFSPTRFVTLGSVVCLVCALSFGPYIALGGVEQLPQILARLFPFKRGLCHAYWAPNTWALYNLADKAGIALHSRLPESLSLLVPLAPAGSGPSFTGGLVHDGDAHRFLPGITPGRTLALVGLALCPAMVKLWRRPSQRSFAACLIYSSFCFFMLSWHVHEKAILMATVPLAPLVLALGSTGGNSQGTTTAYRLFLLLAMTGHLSLFPLCEWLPTLWPFLDAQHNVSAPSSMSVCCSAHIPRMELEGCHLVGLSRTPARRSTLLTTLGVCCVV